MDDKEWARKEAIEEVVLRAIGTGELTIPFISEVSGLSPLDVAMLAVLYYSERGQETSSSEPDDEPEPKSEKSHRIKMLDKSANQARVPMAVSTQRTLKRLDEVIRKLRDERE